MFVIRTLESAHAFYFDASTSEIREPDEKSFAPNNVRITNIGMSQSIHPKLVPVFAFAEALEELSRELVREAKKRADGKRPRTRRGVTLRPGPETPLWNAVVAMTKPQLSRRGARATLARELGVHRARIGEFFDKGSAMPDAERALQTLVLLARSARSAEAR